MMGMGATLRAAVAGTMTVDITGGGDIVATMRKTLLAGSTTLTSLHKAQLASTVGTPEYADGVMLDTLRLEATGPAVVQTTLAQAMFDSISAMRALGYLPARNITDADPSTFFLTRNCVTIANAAEASVIATAETVANSQNLYSSPLFIFVTAYSFLCLLGCGLVILMSRRALAFRTAPLQQMARLPNHVLLQLENAAAAGATAAERDRLRGECGC